MLGKMEERVHLSEELILEILLRLPVKSLLRFKCVCKLWLTLISKPDFATSHFQLSASPTQRLLFVEPYSHSDAPETLSIDFDASINDNSSYSWLYLDFLRCVCYPQFRGSSSCRGFLFLHSDTGLYLWNPSTGVNRQIPESPINTVSNRNLSELLSGFGYDQSKDDYLVVLGFYDQLGTGLIYLMIFSLRANEWKQIEVDYHFPYMTTFEYEDGPKCRPFLNGSIHWLVYDYETGRDVITAFDLQERRLSEISLSDDFSINRFAPVKFDLLVLDGLICVWLNDMHTVKIWVMQEYAVHSSWTKIIEFSFNPVSQDCFYPLCFTKSGDIVGADGKGGLGKFNDKRQLLEHNSDHIYYSDISQSVVYTESLLSLPADIEQA